MSTTRKMAPGKAQPAAAARQASASGKSAAPARSAAAFKGQPKPLQFRNAPLVVDPHAAVHTVPGAASVAGATGLFVGTVPLREWARGETLQSDSRPYVLYYRGTRYALIGPFGTTDEASSWALDKRNNPHDDPRWQVIELAPEHRMPRLATPWEASLAIQAGNL